MANIDDINDVLRGHVRRAADILWALDSARSLRRKAESGVYRSSERTGDGRWDAARYGSTCTGIASKTRSTLATARKRRSAPSLRCLA